MSFIVKGIDLPKDEKKPLKIEIWSNGDVYKDYGYGYEHKEGITIQIPKEHGRIGDFDLFKNMIRDSVPAYRIGVKIPTYGDMDIMDKIEFMPTILEAEE